MDNLEENLTLGVESYSDGSGGGGQPGIQSNIPNQFTNHPTDFCPSTVPYLTPVYQGPIGYVPPTSFYTYPPAPVAADQISYYYPYPASPQPPPQLPIVAAPGANLAEMVPNPHAYMTPSGTTTSTNPLTGQQPSLLQSGANHLPPSAMPTYLAPPAVPSATSAAALQHTDQHTAAIHGLIYLQQECTNNNSVVHQLTHTAIEAQNPHQTPLPMQPHMSSSVPYGLHALQHQSHTANMESLGSNNGSNEAPVFIQNSQYCHNRKSSRGRGTSEKSNREVKGGKMPGGRKQISSSCTTTPYVSSMDEFTTSGTESCRDYRNNAANGSAPRKPRRRSRKSSAGMCGASSSESLNVPQQKTCSLIPLSVHKGPVLNLDPEEFPGLPQGGVTESNDTVKEPSPPDARFYSSGAFGGWSKSGSDVLKAPYKPDRSVASQTDFGSKLSFLTLLQQSPMFRGDQVAGSIGAGMLGGSAALLDNDSGYSSPKTRPSDSAEAASAAAARASNQSHLKTHNMPLATTSSIGVSVAPPVPAANRVSAVSSTSDRTPKPLQNNNSLLLTPQQSRKKKKRATSRKKRGTLTMANVNQTTTDGTEEDIDLFARIDDDFPVLVSSHDKATVKPANVTLGAGLQAFTTVKQQSATTWKSTSSGEKHQATLVTHSPQSGRNNSSCHVTATVSENESLQTSRLGAKISNSNEAESHTDASMRTPILVSTSVSQSIKAKNSTNSAITTSGSVGGKPTKELPLTAFIKEPQPAEQSYRANKFSRDAKSFYSRPEKGTVLSDGELINGYTRRFDLMRNENTVNTNPRPIKKGKQREIPKPKKPSALKKVILQEREDRKKLREDCLINNENPPRVVNDQTVLSMEQTLEKNLTDVYNSVLDDRPVFDGVASVTISRNGLSVETTEEEDNFGDTLRDPLYLRAAASASDGVPTDSESRRFSHLEQSEDNEESSCYSSTGHLSSNLPASTIPSRSGSATTLFSLPEFPSGCWTSDSDCPYIAPNIGRVKREVLPKIHNRKFREYCNQVVTKEINAAAKELLQKLCAFQNKAFFKTEITKIKYKRRLVMGLKEVKKHLELEKLKLVIFSPSLEKVGGRGGLDEMLDELICLAREKNTPFVFALSRKEMGSAANKIVPVSCVGIFNYQGAESFFNKLMDLTETAREKYKELIIQCQQEAATSKITVGDIRSQSSIAEHPVTHFRSCSNPLQIVTSFSCDDIDEQIVSKFTSLSPYSSFSSHSKDRFSQPENTESVEQADLAKEEMLTATVDEASNVQSVPKTKAYHPQTVSPTVVAHQEITLNISISDSVQNGNDVSQ